MRPGRIWIVAAAVALSAGAACAAEQATRQKPSCEKIFEICMKRAGSGHAAICEDLFSQAKNTGVWPATQEPDGKTHDPVPCGP